MLFGLLTARGKIFVKWDYCILIFCHFSTVRWHKELNSFCVDCKDSFILYSQYHGCWSALILGLRPANERRRYFVTTSLIGWV